MSYFVHVSFDFSGGNSNLIRRITTDLNEFGLFENLVGSRHNEIKLPTNVFAGEFKGESASKVRDDVSNKIVEILQRHQAKASFFVSIGGSWAWSIRST